MPTNSLPISPPASAIYPQSFSSPSNSYLTDPLARLLADFFLAKGLPALKDEDRAEKWYDDFLAFQSQHQLYARLLAPNEFSTLSTQLDLFRLTRFLEVFGYFSPAHGYSLQVSFLGLFPILMGDNPALKRQAITALESGGLFAFGVSEKEHGSDLFGNDFTITQTSPGRLIATGKKYYIGNSNCAEIITLLARKIDDPASPRGKRAPFVLFAFRPQQSPAFKNNLKIRTMGVRSAFVGSFEIINHELPESDLFAQGRQAWDAVFGTVTLGKFFLGFGSIGICERALEESADHLCRRILYGKPVIEMPHIRLLAAEAYARLTAMKLFAYRALDYVHAANAGDRRYLLFLAVQKAKVSTQGVKVMSLLSQCIGAKGFESDTYFEMALRDIQLIPGLEGSTHINFAFAAQFVPRYFARRADRATHLAAPLSLFASEIASAENPYLFEAAPCALPTIPFPHFLDAYRPLKNIPNIRRFAAQAKAFALFLRHPQGKLAAQADTPTHLPIAQLFATIVYAHLIAENAAKLNITPEFINVIFHVLITEVSAQAIQLAAMPQLEHASRKRLQRLIKIPQTKEEDWAHVAARIAGQK